MRRHLLFSLLLIFLLLAASGIALLMPKAAQSSKATPTPGASAAETPTAPPTATPENTPVPTEAAHTPEPAPTEDPEPTSEPTPEPTSESTPEPTPAPTVNPGLEMYAQIDLSSPAILGETEDMGQEYLDKIIFLGDSTTYGLRYYAMLSGGQDTLQVWTPASGTLALFNQSFATIVYPDDGSEIPIRDAVAKKKPDMMVITLGVNGVSSMDHDDFLREYSSLVTDIMELSPGTKVIINSIYPVASHYNLLKYINNENICQANVWLVEVAEQTGARFLNTISILMGSDGWLPYDYQNGDGLHLSPDAFRLVLDYIRTHGWT